MPQMDDNGGLARPNEAQRGNTVEVGVESGLYRFRERGLETR